MRLPLLNRMVESRIARWQAAAAPSEQSTPPALTAPDDCPAILVLVPTATKSGRQIGSTAIADAVSLLVTRGATPKLRLSYGRGYGADVHSWFIIAQCRILDEARLKLALRGASARLSHEVSAIELF